MLLKSSITKIRIHSDEWYQARLGKLTSSEIYKIMGKTFNTDGSKSWIYQKIGEELTGIAAKEDIDTPDTRHGNLYEAEAIQKFGEQMNLKFVVTQCLISSPNSRFSGTPDALILQSETDDSYVVRTVEAKCPTSYNAYIGLFLCQTPQDVLMENKNYYWQVIDQMYLCDALIGYLVVYQPFFKAGNLKIIEFKRMNMNDEFKKLKERKELAESYFIEVRDKLLAA